MDRGATWRSRKAYRYASWTYTTFHGPKPSRSGAGAARASGRERGGLRRAFPKGPASLGEMVLAVSTLAANSRRTRGYSQSTRRGNTRAHSEFGPTRPEYAPSSRRVRTQPARYPGLAARARREFERCLPRARTQFAASSRRTHTRTNFNAALDTSRKSL